MCSSLEVRITSDGFRLPELPGTQWPAYVWGCQLLWYAHTLLYWQWNWSYFRIPKPVLSPTVVSSVKSNPENQTDLKQVLELVVRWKKYWFSKRALKLTEHCPLVPLGSQVFSALYRVNRDASCKRKLKEEKWSPLNWKVIILKPVMINKSRRYMWLMQRQINLINGTLFVLEKRNTVISELCQKSCGFDLYSSTWCQAGERRRSKLEDRWASQRRPAPPWWMSFSPLLAVVNISKPWLCWLSRAGPPSTVRSDRIEPVTEKENDTNQVISNRCFCSFRFHFNVINYHRWIHKPHQMTILYMFYHWSFDTSCTWLILNVTNKWERLKCSKLLLAPN